MARTRRMVSSGEGQDAASLPVRAKDDEPTQKLPAGKGNMTVFGDSDDEGAPAPAPAPAKAQPSKVEESKEEEDSDDDEAPEAVSTQAAASIAKKSSQTAQRAAQEQATAQKRRRQERDTLFKQQAEGRRKSRKGEQEQAVLEPADDEEQVDEEPQGPSITRRKARNLLPAEFLTDSSSEDEDAADGLASRRPRKRRVADVEKQLARVDRGPRDEIVGSTVYRVAKKTDERLAPKSKKFTQSSKDVLRRRNRTAVTARGGFFKR